MSPARGRSAFASSSAATARDDLVRLARVLREVREADDHIRVERLEQRQQFVADAVAGEPRVGVGGVLAERLVERGEVFEDVGARDGEEGAKLSEGRAPLRPSNHGG